MRQKGRKDWQVTGVPHASLCINKEKVEKGEKLNAEIKGRRAMGGPLMKRWYIAWRVLCK